jgi:NADPH:quinone reductase-like Zn-dependent oxidoreductase
VKLPAAFATAHDALFTQGELRVGERLLVNGGAGGVGTAAIAAYDRFEAAGMLGKVVITL